MRKPYIIAPEGCRWSVAPATSPELAYSSICSFYLPETQIAVIDPDTMKRKSTRAPWTGPETYYQSTRGTRINETISDHATK